MIHLENVVKTYKVARRGTGTRETLRAFFRRDYTEIRALDGLSFDIPDGEIVGLLGPNGAGKSTAIKILSGILYPDSGTVECNGFVPYKDRMRYTREIGVVFGQRTQLFWDVPVGDSYALLKDIYDIPDDVFNENLEEMTALLRLEKLLTTPARQLSLGQRMRCELAASLLHSPKILFLDEPTIGLDAASKLAVRKFVRDVNERRQTTVILTTHDMQDVEALSERVMMIGKGKLLLNGTLSDIRREGESLDESLVEFYRQIELDNREEEEDLS
ncbi:MAG: ATP-binding cassette domain-containing protein [Lachnospiraceae bacterium]|nr:ATP-binding cassette domain-containing protein [Lachnospiraceae bacterium]